MIKENERAFAMTAIFGVCATVKYVRLTLVPEKMVAEYSYKCPYWDLAIGSFRATFNVAVVRTVHELSDRGARKLDWINLVDFLLSPNEKLPKRYFHFCLEVYRICLKPRYFHRKLQICM